MTPADVYRQAATVRQETGVDPAIVATIASTESNLALAPFTLGITTAASRGGSGSSGQRVGSGSPYAGSSQPAAFWAYSNGAEAAVALKNYILAYQPALAPLLGSAASFFNPDGPIRQSNYYVPTPDESARAGSAAQATRNYYSNWLAKAQNIAAGAGAIDVPGAGNGSDPYGYGAGGVPGGPGTGASNPIGDAASAVGTAVHNFGSPLEAIGSAFAWLTVPGHWWAIAFIVLGAAGVLGGFVLYARQELGATIAKVATA